jgi:hypothetical protein
MSTASADLMATATAIDSLPRIRTYLTGTWSAKNLIGFQQRWEISFPILMSSDYAPDGSRQY